ncbi:MAG: hypothetical protein JSV83_20735 [Desulfobacterales bacterium]|nr:MAG: hypothetical protein JSV83_20735 [Desulfobacterales bacterium]
MQYWRLHNFLRYWVLIFLLPVLLNCADTKIKPGAETDTNNVPARYRALYNELATKLSDLDKTITSQWNGKKADTKFAVELLVANSNRGDVLLTDRVFNATRITLDRLQDLGVRSVAVSIQFPMLTRSFPRFIEYKDFYRRVAWEIRRRGLDFIVEMGTFFQETEFTKFKVDYSNLKLTDFRAGLRQMAQIIIDELRPDYLTILTEPDTMKNNTGLNFTVKNFSTTIRHVVDGLEHRGVKLGAGAGTWDNIQYFTELTDIPQLDYIDMHIYPIQQDFAWDKVNKITQQARQRQKSVSIGEAWLYKVSQHEFGRMSPVKAFARDVFSFWQPLDSLFMEVMVNLSHHVDAEFCSFFWMKYLYGYMDYNLRTSTLRPQQLINKMDAIAGQNILDNTLSKTGEKFKTLITTGQ